MGALKEKKKTHRKLNFNFFGGAAFAHTHFRKLAIDVPIKVLLVKVQNYENC